MRVREILRTDVTSVRPHQSLLEAARLMAERNLGFLPVVDVFGSPLGALTDRDIAMRLLADGRRLGEGTVADAMTAAVVSCELDDSLTVARQQMHESSVARVMVIQKGVLCGVVSLADIAEHMRAAEAGQTLLELSRRDAQPLA